MNSLEAPTLEPNQSGPTDEFWFDEVEAERAVRFFETRLTHVKGELAGRPFILEPWQRDNIIRPLFGWKRKDGTRRYRTAYIEIPRKNGKSTLVAGIGIYMTLCDREPAAEVYSAAGDREQASIVFDIARGMIEQNSSLRSRVTISKKSFFVPQTGSSYKVLSAEAYTKHGLNAHAILFDELHVQASRDLWDTLTTSTGARRQPLTIAITTAGYDRHSICWEIHDYAVKVRDGLIKDDTFLPVIYAAEDGDDWTDEATWRKANPSYGISLKPDYMREECAKAKASLAKQNVFRRLQLNQWTEQETRWLDLELWLKPDMKLLVNPDDLEGKPCWCGLDLSSTRDLSAFAAVFAPDDDCPRWRVLMKFWLPRETLRKRAREDRVPYDIWEQQGWMSSTEGNAIDYRKIFADLVDFKDRFDVKEIAFDPWNSEALVQQLTDEGFNMVKIGQGYKSMSPAVKEFETLLLKGEIQHGNNPVLNWNASNIVMDQDPAGNMKPAKNKSTQRIDGMVALIMATARAVLMSGHSDDDCGVFFV